MRIFITGVTGFIGRNLYEYLKKNNQYKLICPKHKELELLDLNSLENFFKKNKIDIVVHCATLGVKRTSNKPGLLEPNLRMFLNLIKCKKYYKKMIFAGSGAEYDKSKNITKIKETEFGEKIPKDPYGFYKYICSKIIEKEDNIINLRLFGIFGKYEDYKTRFISDAIWRAVNKKPIVINKNVVFDYLYIEDLVKIIEYFILNKAKYKFYNVGSGKNIDLLGLAKKISRISPNKPKIIVKNSKLGNEYTCNNDRMLAETKTERFRDIDDTLKELYLWYETNRKNIK